MKRLLALALIPATVLASECVLQDRTVSRNAVTILERSRITPEVVPIRQQRSQVHGHIPCENWHRLAQCSW
jgi:hypothetical protein